MKIRPLTLADEPRVRELEAEWKWSFGSDYLGALAVVDGSDRPVVIAGAWMIAESHLLLDSSWSTPAHRMDALAKLHEAMRENLYQRGFRHTVTWMMSAMKSFERRLVSLGWVRSKVTSYHRGLE